LGQTDNMKATRKNKRNTYKTLKMRQSSSFYFDKKIKK